MSEKQKRKNDQRPIHRVWENIRLYIREVLILASLPIAGILSLYAILLSRVENVDSVYWFGSTPRRIVIYIVGILAICLVYIIGKRLLGSLKIATRQLVPIRVMMACFLSLILACYILFAIVFNIALSPHTEVLKVEYYGLHSYSLQHIAYDYADSSSHYYQAYECKFDLFCSQIYLASQYRIESIDFEIEDNQLNIYANGEHTLSSPYQINWLSGISIVAH